MSKFKFEKTNKYSKLRLKLTDFGFDMLQTKKVIQNIHYEEYYFNVGTYMFACDDIYQTIGVDGNYLGEISEGYHVFSIKSFKSHINITKKEQA